MSEQELNESVGQLVAKQPGLSRVFEELSIDFCCGGNRPLGEVCTELGLDAGAVVEKLRAATSEKADGPNCLEISLTELCDHIEQTHHAYLRVELPRLTQMANKVADVHGERKPELHEVKEVFAALRSELEPHLMKEEQILFPAVRQMEVSSEPLQLPFGSVGNPIHCMMQEHDIAGSALSTLRCLTADYEPPHDACNTYRALFDGLHELETDLHEHIHKENNILFPGAIEYESQLACATAASGDPEQQSGGA
jgi:regulator of cell morphogenesis and NO signaling